MNGLKGKQSTHFPTIILSELPDGRRSKHTQIVSRILDELRELDKTRALCVPREGFGQEKLSNVRAAVSRAIKKQGLDVATATDDEYFYIWFNGTKPHKDRSGKNGAGRDGAGSNGHRAAR